MMRYTIHARLLRAMLVAVMLGTAAVAADSADIEQRREMVERAHQYLLTQQKDGIVGESRQKFVTASYILACLSSGRLPLDPTVGAPVRDASRWLLDNSSPAFLGDREEPSAGHAVATLMLIEMIGVAVDEAENIELYKRAQAAFEQALEMQDKGTGEEYSGGWRRNDQTRVNDRILTAWYLLAMRAAEMRGIRVPRSSSRRAEAFVLASQASPDTEKLDELGGFSIDAYGLPVVSATAAGLSVLTLQDERAVAKIEAARDWLGRHPPRWHGPNFYESHFFAARGLFHCRDMDDGATYQRYMKRLTRLLRERQEPDGSFPFPPGHGGPLLAMGKGYSTAMAILILNVDRGLIPMDR